MDFYFKMLISHVVCGFRHGSAEAREISFSLVSFSLMYLGPQMADRDAVQKLMLLVNGFTSFGSS